MIGTAQQWKQTFLYDRYGNRRFDTANNNTTTLDANCQIAVCNPTIDPATNKLIGYTFDNSGNTKIDAENRQFIYDAENKQVEVKDSNNISIGKYFYDGDGKRVKKISATETTIFVYNALGQLVAEYSTQIAQAQDAKVSYLTNDHLGSPRITTDANGQVISRRDFLPFGEEISRTNYGSDSVRQKFTSYERDDETNLDFAQARYYNKSHGRFTSPDEPFADQYEDDPQSWNLYIYVGNNPLLFTDSTGLWKQVECSSGNCWEADQNGDTFTSLAKILGASVNDVTAFFGDVNPNNIQLGQNFDLGGFDHFLNLRAFQSIGIDIQGYAGEGINGNDAKHRQDIPQEMQPDKPTNNYMKDGLPVFKEGAEDAVNLFIWLRSGINIKKSLAGRPKFPSGVDRKLVNAVLNNEVPRSALTPQQRETAAQFYEKTAQKINPNSPFKDKQALYNEDRARYLRQGGTAPGGYTEWSKRNP